MQERFIYNGNFVFPDRTQKIVEYAKQKIFSDLARNRICVNWEFSFYEKRKRYLDQLIRELTYGNESDKTYFIESNLYYSQNIDIREINNVIDARIFNDEDKKEINEFGKLTRSIEQLWQNVLFANDMYRYSKWEPNDIETLEKILQLGREYGADAIIDALYAGVPAEDLIY